MNFSWLSPRHSPIVVAHRGSSGRAPENTITAFRYALEDGADAIELDARISKDSNIVVIHDHTLDRTANGSGLVQDYTLKQLKKFNAASLWPDKYPFESIPALAEVLEEFGSSFGINIEIKGDRNSVMRQKLLRNCVTLVQNFRLYDSVMISSFNVEMLVDVGELDGRIIRGLLFEPFHHPFRSPADYAKSLGVKYLIMSRNKMMKKIVSAVHSRGMMMGEFVVNTKSFISRSVNYGIDAIYSDYPSEVRTFLDRMK
jgi:glycerophosphoryl diester phosphodiesterase